MQKDLTSLLVDRISSLEDTVDLHNRHIEERIGELEGLARTFLDQMCGWNVPPKVAAIIAWQEHVVGITPDLEEPGREKELENRLRAKRRYYKRAMA
jgi:hypothetical protein